MIFLNSTNIILIILIIFFFILNFNKNIIVQDKKIEKEEMVDLPMIEEILEPKYQEIIELKKVKPKLAFNYGTNNNYILNDGKKIWQSCVKFLKNNVTIDGFKHGLSKLEFHKSVFKWKGQEVGLELHLVNTNSENQEITVFVFPLSLIDLKLEAFTDLSYYNQKTDIATLNSLFTRIDMIPSYFCCKPNRGHMVNFNLCPIANLLLLEKHFYEQKINKNIRWLVTKPQPFDRTIGLNIISKLTG